jgi:ATP-dependent Clp protease protease subunit
MIKRMNAKQRFTIIADDGSDDSAAMSGKESKESSLNLNSNQVYFYDDVTKQSVFNLNRNLDFVAKNLLMVTLSYNLYEAPPIELYISSDGGEVFSAFSAVDRIKNSRVPVHSYVEGIAASAATLLSVVAYKRFIRKNSFMLIHQVSGGLWGNFAQFKDEMYNLELLMKFIKDIYLTHTKFTEEELDNLLNHDIYLNAEQCLEKGLVDFII